MTTSELPLLNKTALVTGGGRGIGRAIALAFAAAGADVCVMARTESQIDSVANEIEKLGRRSLAVIADVTDHNSVAAAVQAFKTRFERLDVLVNNAGGATDRTGILESTVDDWTAAVRLNIDGVFLVSRSFLPILIDGGGGKIINIGSGMGHSAGAMNSSYRVGKAGSWMLTRCMADELWDRQIEVNELIPGPVETDATRSFMSVGGTPPFASSERVKSPEEVAPLALWLATQPKGGPTGQSFSLARRPL